MFVLSSLALLVNVVQARFLDNAEATRQQAAPQSVWDLPGSAFAHADIMMGAQVPCIMHAASFRSPFLHPLHTFHRESMLPVPVSFSPPRSHASLFLIVPSEWITYSCTKAQILEFHLCLLPHLRDCPPPSSPTCDPSPLTSSLCVPTPFPPHFYLVPSLARSNFIFPFAPFCLI